MKRILLCTIFLVLLGSSLFSQAKTISGKITTTAGEPLPGTAVLVKGTQIGTTSDENGGYKINVPDTYNRLVFQFLGYADQEVEINGRSVIDLSLDESTNALDEVVVIGFGSQSKRRLTSSVSSTGEESFKNIPASDVQNALSGRLPGVVFTNSSGSTNSTYNVESQPSTNWQGKRLRTRGKRQYDRQRRPCRPSFDGRNENPLLPAQRVQPQKHEVRRRKRRFRLQPVGWLVQRGDSNYDSRIC
ncbi:MAG: carboxypeptidase-like regulatory domain-containing protein [Saprospiraceae bacterium]|nr:carboxypeptidase-like regulatory domain-containing protein [Saprospiraceae bacterium]MCF8250781.1 carboxypeptidase-like regulatory domain-containing protein [Saprospiraceae bacterium]MCF8281759.1 carboxypeptidase-like regulatory domain-containing protein [Bacteroidales bacterium]MCF8312582.1 carboxypeptidase-like regulatory domain-containing protein [Saprospiraceae bacterium]MCF8440911.1 carboxypeptidase-like regulatory domain-containing protein [Saprospiraceae bacterium]